MSIVHQFPSAQDLVRELTSGRIAAVELLDTYQQRVQAVNPALNAMVVTRWDEARVEAEQADRARRDGQILGPLHGLPITIKEMFDVAGLPTTAGIRRRRSRNVTRDAECVRRLRHAGAIVMGKTNVPQFGMMAESDNPVYGRSNNPWDLERGPGGSSGGEAAIIAAGASPLGLGSDGGGSIRQPSHACGICGFKPTGGRLPLQGHFLSVNWPDSWAQPGPMARTVADLQLALHVLSSPVDEDRVYGEVPITVETAEPSDWRGLRVGVFEQFDVLPAMSSVRRAVRQAASVLEDVGIETVPFRLERAQAMWDLFTAIFYAEGLRDLKRQGKGSPLDWRIRKYFQLTRLPRWLRRPSAWIGRRLGQPHIAHTLSILRRPVVSAEHYCEMLAQMHGLRQLFSRQLRKQKLIALLGPTSPVAAFPHGEFYANYSLMYTSVFNLLGVPAGTVPVTRVRADELEETPCPRDSVDQAMWRARQNSAGLPIGVQVIGPWWSDARTLALMRLLEERLREMPDFPTAPPDFAT